MNLILASDVVVDACTAPSIENSAYGNIRARAHQRGDALWIYVGVTPTLAPRAMQTAGAVRGEVESRLRAILAECQGLAALPAESELALQPDAELAQSLAAAKRLGPDTRLVTGQPARVQTAGAAALSPDAYLGLPAKAKEIPFIDLERQQARIRAGLETALHRVLHHGQYILGPEIAEMEKQLAAYVGVKHAISVASGTDALLIALMALDIAPGDEVITVPYTWISTAEVIALLRAKTVFVDIEPGSMNMDPAKLEKAITAKTKAIMPVGIYGQCANMTAINAIAARAGIPVIEDAAQCFGATHHGKRSCALSLIGCTSFFPSKPLGCYGDGGAMFTPDDALADKMRQIRVHGQKVKHQHPVVGINGRMDTLQAAVVIEKLKIFDDECRLRVEIHRRYNELLKGIPGLVTPAISEGNTSVYAQYTILIKDPDAAVNALRKEGIPAVSYYRVPLHLQGAFSDLGHARGDFPVAERIASECLSLPMSPYMTAAEQEKIAAVLRKSA